MADWSHPQLADNYVAVLLTHLSGRDIDAITLQKGSPSNLPDGAMAYDRSTDLFKEWDGTGLAFVNKILSVAGGGTGGNSQSTARTNLGLGSMSTQNSNSVAITGGSISGVTLDASVLTTGIVALARGGTGATLSLGANGTILQSNGSSIVFGVNGSQLLNLNASQLTSGSLAAARINGLAFDGSGITNLNASNLASGVIPAPVIDHLLFNGSGITDLNANNLTVGTVPLARLPTGLGGIFGIAQSVTSTQIVLGSSYTALGLSVTAIPASTSHRVMIFATLNGFLSPGNTQIGVGLFRNGSLLFDFARVGNADSAAGANTYDGVSLAYIDAPGTTSAVTYDIRAYYYAGSFGGYFQLSGHGQSSMIIIDMSF